MRKKYIVIVLASIFFLLALSLVFILFDSSYINASIEFSAKYPLVGPMLLIIVRTLGIIFPVVPAGVVSFAAVPIFGWFYTYVYTLIGILIGTSIAFFLARIYREHFVQRFMTIRKIHALEDEMSKKKEFLAIVALRLFTVPIMDLSSYIAGLTKISYKKFILATFIASFPDIVIFYIGEETYKRIFGKSIIIGAIAFFTFACAYYILRRYKLLKEFTLFKKNQ